MLDVNLGFHLWTIDPSEQRTCKTITFTKLIGFLSMFTLDHHIHKLMECQEAWSWKRHGQHKYHTTFNLA